MTDEQEAHVPPVPETAKHGKETSVQREDRWHFVEPASWTARMIAALETGVKGGRWFSLMDKVYAPRTLQAAWERVKRNRGAAGVDGQSIAAFEARAERYLEELATVLRAGTYHPQPVKRVWIEKPGRREKRPLGIPTVKDRIVQTALELVLEPIFEATFCEQSYGFRPGRGCKDALRRVETLLQQGAVFVVDADIQHYFDAIPHARLMDRVRAKIADGQVLALVERFLAQGVMEGMARWEPEAGTPQGAVISPLLANIYLDALDRVLEGGGWEMVRYADDFVVLCPSQAEAEAALRVIQAWMTAHGLTLHPDKSRIVDARARGGFDFLGYHFERGTRWPKNSATKRLRAAVKAKTRRNRGGSMATIIAELTPLLRGWYAYYRHSRPATFGPIDGYVRGRLRSIVRKRAGRTGRARGCDHQRYPNALFIDLGLFTMARARRATGNPR
jgi:RNA-directed DNA polymerase